MILEALHVPLMAVNMMLAADVVSCQINEAPKVIVRPEADATAYSHNKTTAQLTADGSDTISPYAHHQKTLTQGRMDGYLGIETKISFNTLSYETLRLGCIWYDTVEVTLKLSPTIHISRDLRKNGCEYKAVLEHEQKHVRVDREIVNKYAQKIGVALQSSINNIGARGPYPLVKMPDLQKDMQDYVVSVIKTQQSLMDEERFRRQQSVDTLEEYQRVQAQCD